MFFCLSPSSSSAADASFDAVIGCIEDIIMGIHYSININNIPFCFCKKYKSIAVDDVRDLLQKSKALSMYRKWMELSKYKGKYKVHFKIIFILEDDFQQLQQSFMEKHYLEFDDSDENKLSYTAIFNEYVS